MKTIPVVLLLLPLLLTACARKSDLDTARSQLAEARHEIDTLQSQRVPRSQYEAAQASLKTADARIAAMERELQVSREQVAAQHGLEIADGSTKPGPIETATDPSLAILTRGTYVSANDTFVYSPDALLKFGKNLQISSPSGLMVSDSEQRIVGGDLSIKAKAVLLETADGILKAEPDGTVRFTGTTLTMKFEKASEPREAPPTENTAPISEIPAAP